MLGHADRVRPFGDYCVGLLSAEGRKSVEPLAAVTAPGRTAAQHQSLLHFVAQAPWSVECAPEGGQFERKDLTQPAGLPEDGSHDEIPISQCCIQAAGR